MDRHVEAGAPAVDLFRHAILAGLGDEDGVRQVTARGALQFAREGARVAVMVELDVVDRHALGPQPVREVPHGRKQIGYLLLVMGNVVGLVHHLRHEDDVGSPVEAVQGRDRSGELVAEDES